MTCQRCLRPVIPTPGPSGITRRAPWSLPRCWWPGFVPSIRAFAERRPLSCLDSLRTVRIYIYVHMCADSNVLKCQSVNFPYAQCSVGACQLFKKSSVPRSLASCTALVCNGGPWTRLETARSETILGKLGCMRIIRVCGRSLV